jgi:hypothetical protein
MAILQLAESPIKVSAHIVVQGFVKLQKSVLCAGGKRLRLIRILHGHFIVVSI